MRTSKIKLTVFFILLVGAVSCGQKEQPPAQPQGKKAEQSAKEKSPAGQAKPSTPIRKKSPDSVAAAQPEQGKAAAAAAATDKAGRAWKITTKNGGRGWMLAQGCVKIVAGQFNQKITAVSDPINLSAQEQLLKIRYRSRNTTPDAGITGCAEVTAVFEGSGERRAITLPKADSGPKTMQLPLDPPSEGAHSVRVEITVKDRITELEILDIQPVESSFRKKIVYDFETPAEVEPSLGEKTEDGTIIKWSPEALHGKGALDVYFDVSAPETGKHVGFKIKGSPLRDVTAWDAVVVDVKNLCDYPVHFAGQIVDDPWNRSKPSLKLGAGQHGRLAYPVAAMKEKGLNPAKIASIRVFVWHNTRPVHLLLDNVRLVKGDEPDLGAPVKRVKRGDWTVLTPADLQPPPQPSAAEKKIGLVVFQRSASEMLFPYTRPNPRERVSLNSPARAALAGDEYEPLQIGIFALKKLSGITVNVKGLDDLEPDVRFIDFIHLPVGPETAKTCSVFPCDLIHKKSIDLEKDSCGGFWVTFHAKKDSKQGNRNGKIIITTVEGSLEVPAAVTVYPFILPRLSDKFIATFMTGTYFGLQRDNDPKTIYPKGDKDMEDMAAHGMTCVSPEIWCGYMERDGHPYFPEIEQLILNSGKHGLNGPVLWYCGTPFQTQKARHGRKRDSWEGYPPPTAKDASKYERRELAWTNFNHGRDIPQLEKTVRYFSEFTKKHGKPPLYYMPIDEPNIEPRNLLAIDVLKAVHKAGGLNMQTCTPDSLKRLYDYIDLILFAGPPPLNLVRKWHSDGKKVAFYDNGSMFGPHHLRARILWGFNAWRTELDGAGAWSHLTQIHSYRHPDVLTGYRAEVREADYSTVPNLNWEMIREGVDDWRYATALEKAAAGNPVIKTKADSLFKEMKAALKTSPENYMFYSGPMDHPDYVNSPSPQQVDGWRERIAGILAGTAR